MKSRYTYGNGIDEPVEIEKENAGSMKSYLPMQDTNGNVIGLADSTGKLIEKVNYSSYGAPTFIYDHVAPQVDQVRIVDGKINIRFSEAVDKDKAKDAVKIKVGVNPVSGTLAFADEDRVAVFTSSAAFPQNQALTVSITTQLEDTSGNTLAAEFTQGFTYTGIDIVVFDRVAPETELINLIANKFTIGLSEEIDQASITGSVVVKRGTTVLTGTIAYENPKTISFTLSNSLTNGTTYTIEVNSNLKDLSGKGLTAFSETFTYQNTDLLVYSKPSEKEHAESFIKNTTLFQGRSLDTETGLYYFRARYLHSELNIFLQRDPKGFADSMNPYQSFGNNPVNFNDPMGRSVAGAPYSQLFTPEQNEKTSKFLGDYCLTEANLTRFMGVLRMAGGLAMAKIGAVWSAGTGGIGTALGGGYLMAKGAENAYLGAKAIVTGENEASTIYKATHFVAGKITNNPNAQNLIATTFDAGPDILLSGLAAFRTPTMSTETFDSILKKVDKLDFSTAPDEAVFYSGPGNKVKAFDFALKNTKKTIEMTSGGKTLDSLGLYTKFSRDQASQIWKKASEKFAKSAQGQINLFIKGSLPTGVYRSVEEDILRYNSNIIKWIFRGY